MKKSFLTYAVLLVLSLTLSSCRDTKKTDSIEDAIKNAAEAMEEAADKATEATEDALEEAGEAIDDTVDAIKKIDKVKVAH